MVNCVPVFPVVAERLEMTGATDAEELIETLSKVPEPRLPVVLLLTAKPTYTDCCIFTVSVDPNWLQSIPSADTYALNELPDRTSFSHLGKLNELGLEYDSLLPVLAR